MAILNYTTTIKAGKTASEIQDMLARAGAGHVAIRFNDGRPIELSFQIDTEFGPRSYLLPSNSSGVRKALDNGWSKGTVPGRFNTQEQAERVSWRILKDWVAVQLALIEAGMAALDEIMLPYMLTGRGENTVAMEYRQGRTLAIEGAS